MASFDFVVVGAGIVGLSVALELKRRYPQRSVCVLEKESRPGVHSSGRNSGVLHSGIYYAAKSLKARLCRQGAEELADYCVTRNLPLVRIGKVLVPVRPEDGPQLTTLADRAAANGVEVERLGPERLRELEPDVRSATGDALFVRATAVASPSHVMSAVVGDARRAGVDVRCNGILENVSAEQGELRWRGERVSYGTLINAAGLHADSVAHRFGAGLDFELLPFKGIYWKLDPAASVRPRHLVYPVPDLRVPFLGVHTTTDVEGNVYLGPTAVPAFGRENYRGLHGVRPKEFARIVARLTSLFISGHDGFRRLAAVEGPRYFKPWFLAAARALLPGLQARDLVAAGKVGIRAQMLDLRTNTLVSDFLVERGHRSVHVLNAVSPAWTSSLPFARHLIDHFIES